MNEELSAVIFSPEGEAAEIISLAASEYGIKSIFVSDGENGRGLLSEKSFDLAFVNAPLEKEFGLELAAFAAEKGCGVIIAASGKLCAEISKKIGNADIFVLPKPMNKPLLLQAFRFTLLSREKQEEMQDEIRKLEEKLRDAKLVDRAKCVLVEYLRISEADAHRQIQKRAMDMRVPLTEVARDILKTYET